MESSNHPMQENPRQSWIPVFVCGTCILIVSVILNSLSRIADYKAQESGFHKWKFASFRIPQPNISRIPESGFPSLSELNFYRGLCSIGLSLLTGSSEPTAHISNSYDACWTGLLDTTHSPHPSEYVDVRLPVRTGQGTIHPRIKNRVN